MKSVLCYIDELGSGGAERQITYLAVLLKHAGYDVKVYCYHPIYFYEYLLVENNIELIKLKLRKNNFWNKLKNTYKVVSDYNFDTIIAYSVGPEMIASLIKILKPQIRLIASERNTTQRLDKRERLKFALLGFADFIVPNSYTQTRFIQEHYAKLSKKSITITNYIDTSKFYPSELSISNSTPRFIVAARHHQQKNVPKFIEAVKIAKNEGASFIVDWYGENGGGNKEAHIKMAETYGVSDVLRFHPSVKDIEKYYREADFFCLPSLYEGFPNVICEAMSSGLPIICSNVCDNPFLVKDGVNGFLFDPHSPDDIAKVIIKILSISLEDRKKMGINNRKEAQRLFGKETFLSKYVNLIEA